MGLTLNDKGDHITDSAKTPPDATNTPRDLNSTLHPETAAGGYACNDGTVEFYQRVVAVLPEGGRVLDLGAGRGAAFDGNASAWQTWLLHLANKPSTRVGADVDPVVLTNPILDEAKIIEPGKPLPFEDQSFDLILCDWVIEHIEDPESFVREVKRVLKVGGWFCARTPNRWSYFAIGARLVSGGVAKTVLGRLQSHRAEHDVFPKYYKLNTLGAIGKNFTSKDWRNATYTDNPDPGYVGGIRPLFHMIDFYQRLAPKSLGTVILVFVQRIA
jgi:SAM-dependent methyltransferase